MSRFPACPWRLPLGTSIDARLEIGTQLALEATNSPAIRTFAFGIRDACFGCPRAQLAERILSAVQGLGYVADYPGDWMQPAEYTLEHGGDCEDLTGILLAVCWILDFRARNVWLVQEGEPLDHITGEIGLSVGELPSFAGAVPDNDGPVVPGVVWWWADTTVTGAYFGEWVYAANDRLHNRGADRGVAPGMVSATRSLNARRAA